MVHIEAVLIDLPSAIVFKVPPKLLSHEADITKTTNNSIRKEDQNIADKDISRIVLRVLSIPYDRKATSMQKVPSA